MLSHPELVEVIRWFAVAYLEVETARRSPRALRAHVTPALCSQLATSRRQPIAGGSSHGQRVHLRLTPSKRATLEDIVYRTTASSPTDLVERVLHHTLSVE